jgi:hypothetical protein
MTLVDTSVWNDIFAMTFLPHVGLFEKVILILITGNYLSGKAILFTRQLYLTDSVFRAGSFEF